VIEYYSDFSYETFCSRHTIFRIHYDWSNLNISNMMFCISFVFENYSRSTLQNFVLKKVLISWALYHSLLYKKWFLKKRSSLSFVLFLKKFNGFGIMLSFKFFKGFGIVLPFKKFNGFGIVLSFKKFNGFGMYFKMCFDGSLDCIPYVLLLKFYIH